MLYNYVAYVFAMPRGWAFLVHLALATLRLYTFVGLLSGIDGGVVTSTSWTSRPAASTSPTSSSCSACSTASSTGGTSVIVIKHHHAVMAHADRIVDLGPGAGHDGGRVVFEGTPAEPVAAGSTLTGEHLATYVAGGGGGGGVGAL